MMKGQPAPNKGRKFPAEVLTPAEFARLAAQCSRNAPTGVRNKALLVLAYRSGLRISELLALRPADIDLDRHSIRLLDSKSGTAQTRGFHPGADDVLARWMDTRRMLGISGRARVFCTLNGSPMQATYVRDTIKRNSAGAGITKRITPHSLRHTFAVELESAGVSITTISKLLGHSSIAVTARYLDHLSNGQAVTVLQGVELPALADVA